MTPLQTLAADYSSRFEKRVRDDRSEFLCVKDGQETEELTELCHKAHGDMLPDDYRYAFIVEALDAIAEDGEDAQLEADIYTHELTAWLASRNDRYGYCDEAAEEFGEVTGKKGLFVGMFKLLQLGQWVEKQEVLASVLNSLQELVSGEEGEDF